MATCFLELNLVYMIISSFLVPFSLYPPPHFIIISCLFNHHITNFSIFPTSQNQLYTSYNNLHSVSLQNLRFSNPKYQKPAVIILPESKEQLVSSLLCSKNAAYEVRIRSGGHSYEGLSSVTNHRKPFVVIDMMNLDQILVDLESKTAWVQGGATLGQVYYTIAEQTRGAYGFSAGSCPTVGIGGHIMGGGFGFLSRRYGLAADNVMDVLLVDSEGRVLDRATMGEDVFWAIRGGGGGNFGIVYAWKIKLLEVPAKVTAFQVSREGKIENLSHMVYKWQYVGPYLNDMFYLSMSLGANGCNGYSANISATFSGLYLGPKCEAISLVKKTFSELKIKEDEYNEMSWIKSVLYFSSLNEGSSISDLKNRYVQDKMYLKAKSDYVTKPIPIEGVRGAMEILSKEPKGYIIMDPYGGKMARIANDSIAFPHRRGNLYNIQYLVSWETDDDVNKDLYLAWIRGFYKFMAPFVSSSPRRAYNNYLDLDIGGMDNVLHSKGGDFDAVEIGRVWGQKYFHNNYDRLVKAKTIIDPCNFFRHPQGIPPKSADGKTICLSYLERHDKFIR